MISAKILSQVEVKLDGLSKYLEETNLANFTIEASLYDNTGYSYGDVNGVFDLNPYKVVHMVVKSPAVDIHGFHGYLLAGKFNEPKLWSSEHVSNIELCFLDNHIVGIIHVEFP